MKTFLQISFFFLLITQINFAQWYQQNSPTTQNLNAVTFIDANNGFAVGDSGIIINTTDGGNIWTIVPSGTLYNLTDILFTDTNIGYILGSLLSDWKSLVLKTTNGGSIWSQIYNQGGIRNAIFFIDSSIGWMVGFSSCIGGMSCELVSKTTDGGVNWTNQLISGGILNDIFFISPNLGLSVGGDTPGNTSRILKTTDGGNNWMVLHSSIEESYNSVFGVSESTWFVVGTSATAGGIFMRTTDGGVTWDLTADLWGDLQAVHFSDSINGSAVGRIAVPECPGAPMIHRTSNGGVSWVAISSVAMGAGALMDIYFVDSSNGWAVGKNFCESNLTILHTTNGGVVPVEFNSFTASTNGKEVTLNWSTATEVNNQGFEVQRKFSDNNFVTIGSVKGNGTTTSPNNYTYIDKLTDAGKYFYRLKQIDYSGKYEYSQTVEVNWSPFTTYKLEQNYPNPFNPTTTIGFAIPEKGKVRLSVLNILGEEIKVLLNEEKEAGYHSIDFNGSDFPSGVYFYQLRAGTFVETKKMILLR
jgi:photosystem II stability/assembly factor-like uncharacterized protein